MKLTMMRRFLFENAVDRRVALQAMEQITDRLKQKARICSDKDIAGMALLAPTLRLELRLEVYRPHLMSHPLFRLWTSMHTGTVQRLCSEAVDLTLLERQDDLFRPGGQALGAYRLIRRLFFMPIMLTSRTIPRLSKPPMVIVIMVIRS